MIRQILAFQTEEEAAFWSGPLYYFYPQIDREYAAGLTAGARRGYLEKILREVYGEIEGTINEKGSAMLCEHESGTAQISERKEI